MAAILGATMTTATSATAEFSAALQAFQSAAANYSLAIAQAHHLTQSRAELDRAHRRLRRSAPAALSIDASLQRPLADAINTYRKLLRMPPPTEPWDQTWDRASPEPPKYRPPPQRPSPPPARRRRSLARPVTLGVGAAILVAFVGACLQSPTIWQVMNMMFWLVMLVFSALVVFSADF